MTIASACEYLVSTGGNTIDREGGARHLGEKRLGLVEVFREYRRRVAKPFELPVDAPERGKPDLDVLRARRNVVRPARPRRRSNANRITSRWQITKDVRTARIGRRART